MTLLEALPTYMAGGRIRRESTEVFFDKGVNLEFPSCWLHANDWVVEEPTVTVTMSRRSADRVVSVLQDYKPTSIYVQEECKAARRALLGALVEGS